MDGITPLKAGHHPDGAFEHRELQALGGPNCLLRRLPQACIRESQRPVVENDMGKRSAFLMP